MYPSQEFGGPYARERRFRRFNLQIPVFLTFSTGGMEQEVRGVSRNVSTGGLLLKAGKEIPLHTAVYLTMQVQGPSIPHPVYLIGEGKVVRVEHQDAGFAIAIECKTPITERTQ